MPSRKGEVAVAAHTWKALKERGERMRERPPVSWTRSTSPLPGTGLAWCDPVTLCPGVSDCPLVTREVQ